MYTDIPDMNYRTKFWLDKITEYEIILYVCLLTFVNKDLFPGGMADFLITSCKEMHKVLGKCPESICKSHRQKKAHYP